MHNKLLRVSFAPCKHQCQTLQEVVKGISSAAGGGWREKSLSNHPAIVQDLLTLFPSANSHLQQQSAASTLSRSKDRLEACSLAQGLVSSEKAQRNGSVQKTVF